ncbi:MAG: dicarboxylate/amino acid:cation symporter [Deltaproteobacteria bacterium]|jgi:Na+/H+-dicarboxylate symporter|nr:dicarboxylate/amino acid:cation symporter [Deltaproteobacteria bacterium]MBW2540493.1 dicarboxylate/amino acid:cation symporter [Deltaproteobacteria bacterium]
MQTDRSGRLSLTFKIVLGMGAGLVFGLLLNWIGVAGWIADYLVDGLLHVGGSIFLASLKLLVVPLVFVSLVCGTAALDDVAKLGRVGVKTLGLYLTTTAIAVSLALIAATIVQPGAGFELDSDTTFEAQNAPSLTEVFIDLFPTNPVQAMADGNMLQIIVFAGLFGIALTLSGEPGKRVLAFFSDLNAVIMRLVMFLMEVAPYGVFCLIAKVFALQGFAAMLPLLRYFFLVLGVLILHALITYSSLLRGLAGVNPIAFFRKMRDPIALGFSTASSNATLPVTLETVEHKLGVNNSVASFTIPLGATINMDGTAIMQGVATGFIAQAYGIHLMPIDYLMVVVTATLASIGTAGVPGVGLIMLAMVLRQVNLPVEGIALVLGVDRLLDMVRTAVNVTGDASVSCVVAASEGQLSRETLSGKADEA